MRRGLFSSPHKTSPSSALDGNSRKTVVRERLKAIWEEIADAELNGKRIERVRGKNGFYKWIL